MYFGDGYYMAGMHALWWVFWLIIIVLAFGLLPRSSRRDRSSNEAESPHEILRRRLASGEITREQYEEIKQVLDRDG